jgi:hypothetical protein
MEGDKMTTKTMPTRVIPSIAAIRRAMENAEISGKLSKIFAKIEDMEFERRLNISIAQADRGEFVSEEELERRLVGAFA